MKQKLWIFGDSFADPETNHVSLNHEVYWDGWSHWLKKDYEVENFADSGLGADTCFLRLCQKVDFETHDFENISVIFVLPNFNSRFALTGYEANKSWAFMHLALPRKEFIDHMSMMAQTKEQMSNWVTLHDRYHEFAKVFITDYMETKEYKNRANTFMGALDCYAKHFKRFILIPVTDISSPVKTKPANHFQHMTVRSDISLHKLAQQGKMPDDEMYQLLMNQRTRKGRNIPANDPKLLYANHLDLDNNKIVYDIVKKWMDQVG